MLLCNSVAYIHSLDSVKWLLLQGYLIRHDFGSPCQYLLLSTTVLNDIDVRELNTNLSFLIKHGFPNKRKIGISS